MKTILLRVLYSIIIGLAVVAGWMTYDYLNKNESQIKAKDLTVAQISELNTNQLYLTLHLPNIPLSGPKYVLPYVTFKDSDTKKAYAGSFIPLYIQKNNPNINIDVTKQFLTIPETIKNMTDLTVMVLEVDSISDNSTLEKYPIENAYFTFDKTETHEDPTQRMPEESQP